MAALRSVPGGDRHFGIGSWAVALLAAWSVPAVAGLGVILLASALGPVVPAGQAGWLLGLHAAGWMLAFSPLLSWIGLLLLVPLAWGLLRAGRAGWAAMAAAGALAGALALVPLSAMGGVMTGGIVVPFGAAAALILRATLAWLAPSALTPADAAHR